MAKATRTRVVRGRRSVLRPGSALSRAETVEQAAQLVERAEGDGDLALLAAAGALLDEDLKLDIAFFSNAMSSHSDNSLTKKATAPARG